MSAPVVVSSVGERLSRVLTHSEIEALRLIVDAVPGDEGIVVNSQLANRAGVTRSVVVNALRICEAAGAVETRSLGMKGTWIRFIDRGAVEQAVAS